jgi:hypothetical protein
MSFKWPQTSVFDKTNAGKDLNVVRAICSEVEKR